MHVLIVGEGPHEQRALPVLVHRIQPGVSETSFDLVKNGRRVHGKGRGMFKKAVGWMLDAQFRGFDALVFLTDEDGDRSRRTQMDQAQDWTGSSLPRVCGVAIRKFDAWFLADEAALQAVLGVHVPRQPEPEKTPDPKAECKALLDQSGGARSLGDLYAQAAQQLDFDTLSQRCRAGFAPFAHRVRALAQVSESKPQR